MKIHGRHDGSILLNWLVYPYLLPDTTSLTLLHPREVMMAALFYNDILYAPR